jgi:Flp pilus assembly protein TadD
LIFLLSMTGAANSREAWDAPAFSTPAAQLLQAATAVKREVAVDVIVLLDERRFVFDAQHRLTRTNHLVYRVDSPDGVTRWAASSARWQPWHQARPTIRARVIGANGREHTLDPGLLKDSGTRSGDSQVYDDDHIYEGPLPAVEVGAVVEEEIVLRDEQPFFAAGAVFREYVGRPVPVLHTRVIIEAPEELPLRRLTSLLPNAQATEVRENGRVRWTYEFSELEAIRALETNLPPETPAWPSVEFSSAESWEAVAESYRAATETRIRIDDARPLIAGLRAPVRGGAMGSGNAGAALGAKLTNSLPSSPTREYIAKVVERLHREVRYTGVEFGAARLIPEYPAETLRRRFGDCKDKATLLIAALRASGIEAYLALLAAGDEQDVSPDLPGLGMFNHAIVYLPSAGDAGSDLWIDATAEYARVGTLPAAAADRLALIVRPGEKSLTRTPAMRSTDNRQLETREFFLSEYGPARIVETTETHGTIENEYRGWYAGADSKERRDELENYARQAYRAKSLVSYAHTASTDFSKPYSMRLEMKDAPTGYTDLETAAVGVKVANLTARLPEYFDKRLDLDPHEEAGKRTADVVFEPFVTEWRYRIQPPPGFQPRALPANAVMKLGPARLVSQFEVTASGMVLATWRFDTVKSRYTMAETDALITALRELTSAESQLVSFDQVGVALRAEGDFKGALAANDALAAKYPRKAVHRLRNASALLDAGLGARAQREARLATKLEPDSALAWKTLGWMLQHDSVGRRFGAGFDRDGAIAAYRKARALAPNDTDIMADHAVLLEHDADGLRYSERASLDEAVAEYRARAKLLSAEDAAGDDYASNLFYALLYSRRFDELREALRPRSPSVAQRALILATVAAEHGGARAIEASRTLLGSETDRRAALTSAGNFLTRLREYPAAADLIEAGARGQTTTAATTQRIALLRKTRRIDVETTASTDPRGVVMRAFAEMLAGDRDGDRLQALLSRRSAALDGLPVFERAQRALLAGLARQDLPRAVGADLLFSNARVNVDGDDAGGYRVQLRSGGDAQTFYVVFEDGQYRILTIAPLVGPVALLALERIEANDLAGARRWLDWARLDLRPGSSEDPLEGPAFARAWTIGAQAGFEEARAATAMLLADCLLAERALPLLEAARSGATDAATKLSLDLALAKAYLERDDWKGLAAAGARLSAAVPSSALAFRYQQWARIRRGEWDAVTSASRERLARLPDDSVAREMLVHRAEALGEFGEIAPIIQPLIDSGRATASDYNQYAWTSLLRLPVSEQAVDAARMAYDETQGRNFAIAHTLACVYAATGKPREARDLLLKGMDSSGAPDDASWYGFGLVAEAYGDLESARDYYRHVKKPAKDIVQASSVYALSQSRLTALK